MESKLREGYKMTELGALPDEWEVEKLIIAVGEKNDLIVAGPFGSNLKVEDYKDEGIPIIRLQNIDFGRFVNKAIKYISPKKAEELDYHSFIKGDLVLAKLGDPIGKTCIVPDYLEKGIVVADVVRIRVDDNFANKFFILHTLNSYFVFYQLNRDIIGTTRPRVNLSQVRNLLVFYPPLPEQRRIATILSTLDETVEHTEALIEKYKNIKAGLMSDLLTRGIDEEGRIRSEGTHRFKDSALGRVPEEWEFGGFEDMVDKSNKNAIKPGPFGSSLKKEFYVGDGYRVYGQEQVIAGTLSIGDYYVNKHKFEELKSFRIDMDDVLISLVGTTGKVLVVPSKFELGIINPRLLKITPDKRKSNSKFISYLLISGIITNQLATLSHGGTMDVLNGTTIRKLRFGIPQFPEQRRIVEILTAADQRIEKEEAYRDKLLQLKKGLMQDLLTGKVRVSSVSK